MEEFAVFGEMKPLQMKIYCVDEGIHESHEGNKRSLASGEIPVLMEDYSQFFETMSTYGWLEAAANNIRISSGFGASFIAIVKVS